MSCQMSAESVLKILILSDFDPDHLESIIMKITGLLACYLSKLQAKNQLFSKIQALDD